MSKEIKILPNTWAEVDMDAITHNFKCVRKLSMRNTFELPTRGRPKKVHTAPMGILAVVKADAYGHSMKEVALLLDKLGVEFFGVSDVAEGVALRALGIKKPVLIFESTFTRSIPTIVDHQLTPTVCTLDFARKLSKYAQEKDILVKIHVEIDTGMGRLGVWIDQAYDFLQKIGKMKNILVEGIFTHFPVADSDRKFTQHQIKQLTDLVVSLDRQGQIIPFVHSANSMGLIGYETHVFNLSRPGLMLYGLHPNKATKKMVELKHALSVKSKVIFVKEVERGRSFSYGRSFVAKKHMKVATIPIGYNDGYLREFSNKTHVLIQGERCPVIGHVTMDQIIVDVSQVKKVRMGTDVVLLGAQKDQTICADALAKVADTINYEIICHLGNRLQRIFKSKK